MPKRTVSHRTWASGKLKDPRIAASYVNAAAQDSREMFLKALRNVADATQMSKVATLAGLQRESVYRMLSEEGNPRLDSLWAVLEAVGLQLEVQPKVSPERTAGSTNPVSNYEIEETCDTSLALPVESVEFLGKASARIFGGQLQELFEAALRSAFSARASPASQSSLFATVEHSAPPFFVLAPQFEPPLAT